MRARFSQPNFEERGYISTKGEEAVERSPNTRTRLGSLFVHFQCAWTLTSILGERNSRLWLEQGHFTSSPLSHLYSRHHPNRFTSIWSESTDLTANRSTLIKLPLVRAYLPDPVFPPVQDSLLLDPAHWCSLQHHHSLQPLDTCPLHQRTLNDTNKPEFQPNKTPTTCRPVEEAAVAEALHLVRTVVQEEEAAEEGASLEMAQAEARAMATALVMGPERSFQTWKGPSGIRPISKRRTVGGQMR